MADLQRLLKEAEAYFEKKEYAACISMLEQIPEATPEAAVLLENARRLWEEQRLSEEWEIHLANLKKEAMDLFDREEYSKSGEHFSYLARQLPEDRTIADYLALCRQMLGETADHFAPLPPSVDPGIEKPPPPSSGEPEVDPRMATELEIENLRREATLLFNEQKYPESLQIFNYLCHLSPEDRALQESRDMAQKMVKGIRAALGGGAVSGATGGVSPSTPEPPVPFQPLPTLEEGETSPLNSAPKPALPKRPRRKWARAGWWIPGGMILLGLGLMGIFIFWFISWLRAPSRLEIASEPEGANIWLNGELKGQTPFRLEIEPGGYGLRVEKDGYLTFSQRILLQKRQSAHYTVKLAQMPAQTFNAEDLLATARALFSQGLKAEALSRCQRILEKDPKNSGALELREKILAESSPDHEEIPGPVPAPPGASPPPAPPAKTESQGEKEEKPAPAPPAPPEEVTGAEGLEKASIYRVIHRHFIGECQGRLAINSRWIAYLPDARSGERFLRRLKDIEKITVGKTLHIQFRNRSFRFELPETGTEEERREKLVQIHRQITSYMAEENP
jgi:tetratricopeptide (TPR) repeat protein